MEQKLKVFFQSADEAEKLGTLDVLYSSPCYFRKLEGEILKAKHTHIPYPYIVHMCVNDSEM